jgi:hypothetical protein
MKKPRRSGAKSTMRAAEKKRKLGNPHRDTTTETVAQRAGWHENSSAPRISAVSSKTVRVLAVIGFASA